MKISEGIRHGWMCEREMPQRAIPAHVGSKPPQDAYERDYREGVRLGKQHPDLTLEQALAAEGKGDA